MSISLCLVQFAGALSFFRVNEDILLHAGSLFPSVGIFCEKLYNNVFDDNQHDSLTCAPSKCSEKARPDLTEMGFTLADAIL